MSFAAFLEGHTLGVVMNNDIIKLISFLVPQRACKIAQVDKEIGEDLENKDDGHHGHHHNQEEGSTTEDSGCHGAQQRCVK